MSEKKKAGSPGTRSATIYRLKIVLCYIKPLIWRKVQVPGDINLGFLHAVIQVALGWTNSHLHQFIVRGQAYSNPFFGMDDGSGDHRVLDEGKTTLMEAMPHEKEWFLYEYDFGDSWEHQITVEKILAPDPALKTFAECVDGRRASPPDTCGGVMGYEDLLEIIKDPEHEEYDTMMEWLGGGFDPEAFDKKKVNVYLRMLKGPRVTTDQLARVLIRRDEGKA